MKDFTKELSYKTSRSSGAGGQNVNKVETSVTVLWNVQESGFFNEFQKNLIQEKLKNRINAEGFLFLTVSESRMLQSTIPKSAKPLSKMPRKI